MHVKTRKKMKAPRTQEASAVAETKLTVLVDSEPGAVAVQNTLTEPEGSARIRVVHKCNRAAASAENLMVFSTASRLEHVAECVSLANKAHRLTALLVHNDLATNWIPYVFYQSGLRTLRNMIMHSDPELPTRILNAWSLGGEHDFIADAAVIKDRLFVRTCAFDAYSISFDAFNLFRQLLGLSLYWKRTGCCCIGPHFRSISILRTFDSRTIPSARSWYVLRGWLTSELREQPSGTFVRRLNSNSQISEECLKGRFAG
jgi:hypothetical protein